MDHAPQILTVPARTPVPVIRFNVYVALAATTAAAVSYTAFISVRGLPPTGLAVILFASAPLCGALALPILHSRARAEQDDALRWFSFGLGLSVLALFLQLISLPAVMGDDGPLNTSNQGSAWLYLLFHLTLVVSAAAAAFRLDTRWCHTFMWVSLACVVSSALSFVPPIELITADQEFTRTLSIIQYCLTILLALALWAWVVRTRASSGPLRGWVSLTLLLMTYEVLLNALAERRFDAIWWSSLTMRSASFVVLALGCVLTVTSQLRRFEGYSEREISRRESELDESIFIGEQMLASATRLAAAVRPQEVAEVVAETIRSTAHLKHVKVVDIHPTEAGTRTLFASESTPSDQRALDAIVKFAMSGTAVLMPPANGDGSLEQNAAAMRNIEEQFPTAIGLPLRVGGLVIGAFAGVDSQSRQWSDWTRQLLDGLVAQTGPALSRARLFELEHQTAEALQLALLPERLPTVEGVQLAGRYMAGQSGVLVGGDWYDCIELPDGRLSLIVGDVMGKGIKAATLMGRMREASRVLVSVDPAPSVVLDGLNDLVLAADTGQIVTVACLLLDPNNYRATSALAGHPSPILISPSGIAERIGQDAGRSPLLGVASPTEKRPEVELPLEPGCALVMYTDGLVESRSGTTDGVDRLLGVCAQVQQKGLACEEFASAVLSSRQSGEDQPDDIALLVALLS
ncbi:MAG: SpoIIE family protein phosphatase [Actinomycetia bacterium]|nr:SpoIIE family protein phosphatase [Actinomycetes bacterium]